MKFLPNSEAMGGHVAIELEDGSVTFQSSTTCRFGNDLSLSIRKMENGMVIASQNKQVWEVTPPEAAALIAAAGGPNQPDPWLANFIDPSVSIYG
jgi:hypothetical protein